MATTSLGSSTTQMACTSRRGSRQIRQRVASATLKHSSQNRTRALTSVRESTSRSTSAGSACSRWNAIRCALLGPTPGSLPSSSISSWLTARAQCPQVSPVASNLRVVDTVRSSSDADRRAGRPGRQLVVRVGPLLAGQGGDGIHDLVGEQAARLPGGQVGEGRGVDGPAEGDPHPRQPGKARPDRLHLVGAGQTDRHDRHAGGEREPGHTGAPLVEATVARAGALGVDAEPTTFAQHEEGGVERLLGRPRGVPVDGDRVGVREKGTPDRSTHPGAGEVVGLREEGHRPRRRDRDGERVDERQVVARDQHATGGRDVLGAGDGRPPDHLGQGCDHAVADAVRAGAHRGSSAMTVPPRMRSTTGTPTSVRSSIDSSSSLIAVSSTTRSVSTTSVSTATAAFACSSGLAHDGAVSGGGGASDQLAGSRPREEPPGAPGPVAASAAPPERDAPGPKSSPDAVAEVGGGVAAGGAADDPASLDPDRPDGTVGGGGCAVAPTSSEGTPSTRA